MGKWSTCDAKGIAVAFEFYADAMFKACCAYLAKGLRIIPLEGITEDGRCTCGAPDHRVGGAAERSVGKHPVHSDWKNSYARSEDDILDWIDRGKPFNVGVILGPEGGVIDIEDDSPEARAYRESMGFALLETPTWVSGKSTHQLCAWDERFERCKGVEKPGGLEVRLGAGGASIQSVLPPSWHYSGTQYQWKTGFGLDDVEIKPPPRNLLEAVVNGKATQGDASPEDMSPFTLAYRAVQDGQGRHKSLLRWAWAKVAGHRSPMTNSDRIVQEMLLVNSEYIKPPKSEKEVRQIVHSCLQHYRKKREGGWKPRDEDCSDAEVVSKEADKIGADGDASKRPAVASYAMWGLRPVAAGNVTSYEAVDWTLQTILHDPPELVLCVPSWESTRCHGRVRLTGEQFLSAKAVAKAVFLATHSVILDADSKLWNRVWAGVPACKATGGVAIPGIRQQLIERQKEEDEIAVGSTRMNELAGWVLTELRKAKEFSGEARPKENGRPVWLEPGKLVFHWGAVWEEVSRQHAVMPGERIKIRNRIIEEVGGVNDWVHERIVVGGRRAEFVVFTLEWLGALEKLAGGA